jgi:2-methylcitrate dehydratase PrpD
LPTSEAAYPGTDYAGPFYDVGNALMSAQYCLAVALLKRSFQSEDLLNREDAALLKLVQQINVIPDETLKPRSFILEIDTKNGKTLTKVSSSSEDEFDWNRNEEIAHLESMAAEMPFSADRIKKLVLMTLTVEEHTAKEIVTATIV